VLDNKEEFSGIFQRNSIMVSAVKGTSFLPRLARKIEKREERMVAKELADVLNSVWEVSVRITLNLLIHTGSSFAACLSQENGEK